MNSSRRRESSYTDALDDPRKFREIIARNLGQEEAELRQTTFEEMRKRKRTESFANQINQNQKVLLEDIDEE